MWSFECVIGIMMFIIIEFKSVKGMNDYGGVMKSRSNLKSPSNNNEDVKTLKKKYL